MLNPYKPDFTILFRFSDVEIHKLNNNDKKMLLCLNVIFWFGLYKYQLFLTFMRIAIMTYRDVCVCVCVGFVHA